MRFAAVVLLALSFLTCESPEATRQRAEGPGGDPRNWGEPIVIHGPKDPYHGTPRLDPRAPPAEDGE